MDASDLTRALVGLAAAVSVPPLVPGRGGHLVRVPVACLLAAWAVGPVLDEWSGPALIVLAGIASLAIRPHSEAPERSLGAIAIATAVVVIAGAVAIDSGESAQVLSNAVSDDAAVIVIAGGLVAVFAGGSAIGQLLRPFAARLQPAGSEDLARAGRLIGWLERALLYGFVVAGTTTGVALVVAAKSLARLPSLSQKDRFAEYFLIGTLASVLVAVGIGVAVRAILGLEPSLA